MLTRAARFVQVAGWATCQLDTVSSVNSGPEFGSRVGIGDLVNASPPGRRPGRVWGKRTQKTDVHTQ